MRCKKCGHNNDSSFKFCENCGALLDDSDDLDLDDLDLDDLDLDEEEREEPTYHRPVRKQPKKSKGPLIGVIIAIVVIIIIALVFIFKGRIDKDDETESVPTATIENSKETKKKKETENETETVKSYDTSHWDERFPKLPSSVKQKYYVIFYEGTQKDRIELSVFNLDGDLKDSYLVWSKAGDEIKLNKNRAVKNCNRYYYNGKEWVEYLNGRSNLCSSATSILSSNIDIKNTEGRMILEHVTEDGIPFPIDEAHIYTGETEAPAPEPAPVPEPAPAPVPAPAPAPAPNYYSGYIFPGSDYRYISKSELSGFSAYDCILARNEIYARHGRMFNDAGIQSYFNGCSWYVPTTAPEYFSASVFNEYEAANIDTIISYESDMGYN